MPMTADETTGLLRRDAVGSKVASHRDTEGSPVKVLIADDSRLMLEGFRRALQQVEDIEIVGATHAGGQVLPLIERRRPEVVVIELSMQTPGGARCLDAIVAT